MAAHTGNSPLHLAMYSLRTVPAMNSSVRVRARSVVSGIINRPDVNLSSLLTAIHFDQTGMNFFIAKAFDVL
jgi:hypothetical protein